jgi:gliding-associated putative ABC transporter substrate-binding component GldG
MEVSRRRRRLRGTTESLGLVVLVALGLIFLNGVSARVFARLDLTQGRIYTLGASSRSILSRLDDIITVQVFFSTNLPPQLKPLRQQVEDLLGEYVAHARGRLRVEWVDPLSSPELEQRAQFLGIPALQMQSIKGDEAQIVRGFMGLAVLFEDRKEVLPVVRQTSNLEYELTAAIVKVSSREQKVVGLVAPASEEQREGLRFLREDLGKQYRLSEVSLSGETASIPSDVATLLVVGSPEVSDRGRWEIDQFLMRGGRALFLADGVEVPPGSMQAYPRPAPYNEMLKHYGAVVGGDLVLDVSSAMAPFDTGVFRVVMQYPFWVRVLPDGFAEDNPAVSELETLVLPWTSTVEAKPPEGVSATVLARSSPQAWVQQGFFNLNPQQPFLQMAGERKQVPLAVALAGRFKSFYAGKTPPGGATPGQNGQPPRLDEAQSDTQVVVVGSSRWATDYFLQQFAPNRLFLLNAVDWLTLGPELISVRSRGGTERPLEPVDEKMRTLLKTVNVALMPALVVLFGAAWYVLRRRSRHLVESFGG